MIDLEEGQDKNQNDDNNNINGQQCDKQSEFLIDEIN